MEYKLIKILGEQIEYIDDRGRHHQTTVDDLICENAIPYFSTKDTHKILKRSRSDSGEFTLDRSGRLLWTPRTLRTLWIALTVFFAGCIMMSALCSARTIPVHWFGHSMTLFGGIFFFSLAFAVSDIMNELFGYRATRQMIVSTSIALLCMSFMLRGTLTMPGFFQSRVDATYLEIFVIFPNAFAIHAVSLFFGDLINARLFSYLRGLLVNRYLWFRSFVSTFVSQFFYTCVCATLACFYDEHTTQTLSEIIDIAMSDHIVKMGIALGGLPLVYAIVKWAYWWGRQKTIAIKLQRLNREPA